VSNFTYDEGQAHITVDLQVNGPQGELVLQQKGMELLRGKAPSLRPGTLRTAASLKITPAAPPGRYEARLSVEDRLGRRAGLGIGSFTLLGTPVARVKNLTLTGLRTAAEDRLPPGAVVPVAFELKGFGARKARPDRHELDLGIETSLEDSTGQVLEKEQGTLLRKNMLFHPPSYPFEHSVVLPPDLAPGKYRIVVKVKDRIGGGQTTGLLRLTVVPRTFGIYNLHTHDAAGLPRTTFRLGEQAYVRLSVHGLKVKGGRVKASLDMAVGGPGGVYMAHKNARTTVGEHAKEVARAGRFPAELPLILPALTYTGKYQIVIRARDQLAGKETVREHKITLEGNAPPPLKTFKVDDLAVRDRPDLPTSKGDTFGVGRTYHLELRVGGAKLDPVPGRRSTYRVKIKADLRLKLGNRVMHQSKELFKLDKVLTHKPLRIVIPTRWQVPNNVPTMPGVLYDLEVVAEDLLDNRVSQFIRRVEVVGRR
jgi:hypothetical protein